MTGCIINRPREEDGEISVRKSNMYSECREIYRFAYVVGLDIILPFAGVVVRYLDGKKHT